MRKLKTRLADINSRLWRNKADKAWAKVIHLEGKCAVCGVTESQLQAHHLIPREVLHFRHVRANGVLLCVRHHKYGVNFSAHKSPAVFMVWLKDNRPDQWSWLADAITKIVYPTPPEMLNFKRAWAVNILQTAPSEDDHG